MNKLLEKLMKRLTLFIIIIVIIFLLILFYNLFKLSPAQVLSWSDKTVKPINQYTIDVNGYDIRAYETIPLGNPNIICLHTFTTHDTNINSGKLFCFPKGNKEIK